MKRWRAKRIRMFALLSFARLLLRLEALGHLRLLLCLKVWTPRIHSHGWVGATNAMRGQGKPVAEAVGAEVVARCSGLQMLRAHDAPRVGRRLAGALWALARQRAPGFGPRGPTLSRVPNSRLPGL